MTIDTSRPFILLDDARERGAGPARLYADPVEVIVAHGLDEVRPALERLRAAQAAGLHAAGFISYEAGLALEGRLRGLSPALRASGKGGNPHSQPVQSIDHPEVMDPRLRGDDGSGAGDGDSGAGDDPIGAGAGDSRAGGDPIGAGDGDRGGSELPLLWFGLFERFASLDAAGVAALLPDPAGAWAGAPRPRIGYADYAAAFDRVAGLIASGDIYQANLSFRADVAVAGGPLALYAALRGTSHGGWGGVVFTGQHWLLSCSPELFFTLDDGALTARPMKGTARRGADSASDTAAAEALAADAKERAENLMIVDLLRNDLARVAEAGSVAVPALFTVETYPTIHTLTSTVTARLAEGQGAIDVLAAIFPCGSVTGAPKIRAMEIIAGVEADARGAYTGSIGWLDPAGNAAFNVAIRTLALEQGGGVAELGLGSAVVADSTADGEWRECLAKGAFVTAAARPFDLIETMRFDPMQGVIELERHLARVQASADAFGFAYSRHDARNELQAATFRLRETRRVRLLLAPSGAMAVEVRPLPANPAVAMVAIAPLPVAADDFRLRHKTSDRGFYDEARRESGAFEVVFVDAAGFLTEGSFTNIFVERDGKLVTPPLTRGLLPGVLRAALIAEGRAVEGDLAPADLAGGFFVGNALRGLIPARLA